MSRERTMRVARRVGIGASLVLVVSGAAAMVVTTSPAVARSVVSFGLSRSPVPVSVASVEGPLRGPLVLRGVEVEHLGARMSVDRIVVDWRLLPLLRRRLAVDSLHVTGVTGFIPADYPPGSDDPEPDQREGPPPVPDLPVDVVLADGSVRLDRIEVEGRGEVRAVAVTFAGSLEDFEVDFELAGEAEPVQEFHVGGRLSGAVDAYRLALGADFVSAELPRVSLAVGAAGSLTGVTVDSIRVDTENGFASVEAEVSWYPQVAWSLTSVAELLDIAALTPEPEAWPGSLSFQARSEGRLDDAMVVASAHVEDLNGAVRGEPLRGELHAEIRSPSVSVELLELYWGRIELHASGFVLDTADLDFSLDIPDLGQAVPGATGRITAEGVVTGTPERPRVVGAFDVADVLIDSVGVRGASGRVAVDLGDEATNHIEARAEGISAGETNVDSVTIVVRGTQGEHALDIGAWLPDVGLRLAGTGALALPAPTDSTLAWSGRVDALALETVAAGPWRLEAPAELYAAADSASVSTVCLTQSSAEVCVQGARNGVGTVAGLVRIGQLPLAGLAKNLPPGVSLEGRLDADATFALEVDGTLTADGEVTTEGVVTARAGADSERITFGGDGLRFVVDRVGARGDGALTLRSDQVDGVFQLEMDADLPGFTSAGRPTDDQDFSSHMRVESADVAFLGAFVPAVDSLGGRLTLDATAFGTVGAPALRGSMRFEDGLVRVDSAGLFVDEIRVVAESEDAGGITVEGSARSGEGSARVEGVLTGPLERPRVAGTFDVTDFNVGAVGVRRALGRIDIDLAEEGVNQVEARAEGISSGTSRVDSVSVLVRGTHQEHDVGISAWLPDLGMRLAGAGALGLPSEPDSVPSWVGRVDSVHLDGEAAGSWRLGETVHLFASADSVSLGPTCLRQSASEFCIEGGRDLAGTLGGRVRMAELPLVALPIPLPPRVSLAGRLDGDAAFALEADGTLRADGTLTTAGILTTPAGADSARFTFGGDGLRFVVDSVGGRGQGALTLRSDRAGGVFDLDAEGELPGFSSIRSPLDDQVIDGRVRIESSELAFLAAFLPTLDSLGGRFGLDAAASGTVGAPSLRGSLALEEGLVHLATAGLFVHDVTFSAQADERAGITLEGSARSGEGSVQLEGRTRLEPSPDDPLTLTIRGDRFRAVGTPEVQVEVGPDLDVRYDGSTIVVEGQVAVPWARVELLEVPPAAVAPSADVVIIDEDPVSTPDVDATVRVVVGDDVRFSGFGFTSFIEGDLRVRELPGAIRTVLGELRFVDGRYRAYGQDLVIERGRVSLTGSPEDAAVDVLAVRRAGDGTVAGLEVTGSAIQPAVSLTSDPAMADADVLSYILYGRPLSDGSASEQTQVAGAAATLGANVITTRLASQVGLDDARIEGTTRDQAELVAGKYLTPSVYVSYGVGLFKPSNTFRIKYLLNSNWALRAESGDANGADILYQIERGR